MKKRKSLAIWMLLLLLGSQLFVMTGCTETQEVPLPELQAGVYVYDTDNLFDESVEQNLNSMLVNLEKETGVEFVVLSVQSLLGKSIETYSINVANGLGIGKADEDNGILLLMSRSDNRVRLEIGKGLEGILNDSKCGRILDEFFVPYRENDEYSKATELTVQAVINVISADTGVTLEGVDSEITVKEKNELPIWVWILIILAITLFLGFLISDKGDDDSYSSSGSFFGGSSGGSGFGGGGSFGGGGGSR